MAVVQKVKDTQVFAEECWAELQKVTWPDSDQLRSATLVVILFTIVSYVRARAEGLGEDCKVGFMQRPERLIALALGSLLGHQGLVFVLVLLAVTTNYTVVERLAHIRNRLKSNSNPPASVQQS